MTQGGNKVAWLNANRGRMVGPGRTQEIYAGDSLKLQVHGKYLEDKKQKANAASFMAAGGRERLVADLNELALSTQRAGGANPIALLNLADILAKDLQKKEAPEAYLMYALYDQDSNRYEVGKKVLSKNAANQHEVLEENMYISKDGYMETFVVNETSEDVWFDNMMVMSISSVIVQETHYDPWGLELTGLGFQNGGIKANKNLYNGKELIEDEGLQYYDYGARMYDATIGRWGVVDPLADQRSWISPYNYVQNNPLNRIDPDGRLDDYYNRDGQFLYRDSRTTDNIRIIDQGNFDAIASSHGSDVLNDRTSSDLGLLRDLEDKSLGINEANLSSEAISNVLTDIAGKTDGIDMGKLYNGKISVWDGKSVPGGSIPSGFNDPERSNGPANTAVKMSGNTFHGNAADGTIKVTAIFKNSRNSYLSTVSNVQNALGVHEYQGHGVERFALGGGPHFKAYELQKSHSSWKNTTLYFKNYMEGNYKDYLKMNK